MLKLLVVVYCIFLAASFAGIQQPKPVQYFCKEEYECPKYNDLKSPSSEFQSREFYGAKYLATPLDDVADIKGSVDKAFDRIHKYANGYNSNSTTMKTKTAPIIFHWHQDSNYTTIGGAMLIYLADEYQQDTPVPTDPSVFIYGGPGYDFVLYYRAFGGQHIDPEKYKRESMKLMMAVVDSGLAIYDQLSVTMEYYSKNEKTGKITQRHEVAVVKVKNYN